MGGFPPWLGVSRELSLALAAWRELPDNPLWILVGRMRTHAAPRQRRAQITALVIWGLVVAGLYLTVLLTAGLLSGVATGQYGSLGWGEFWGITLYALICPLALICLLYCTAQIGLQGQLWLARERGDAKNMLGAVIDPLLGLTQLGPREIVIAGLRAYLPLVLVGATVAAAVATLGVVTLANESFVFGYGEWDERAATALLLAPLTFSGYLVSGVIGGAVLLLLAICLGLNSASPVQRTVFMFMLILHQFTGFWAGFLSFAAMEQSNNLGWSQLAAALTGHAYVLAAALAGLFVMLGLRRASSGWLLIVPIGWVFGFWMVLLVAQLFFGMMLSSQPGWLQFVGEVAMHMGSAWSSINLFAMASLPSPFCFGEVRAEPELHLAFAMHYALALALSVALLALAYRAALACAASRLRALE